MLRRSPFWNRLIFFKFLLVTSGYSFETNQENDTCALCDCFYPSGAVPHNLVLNCSDRGFRTLPHQWPSHSHQLTVSFSANPLGALPQLPPTDLDYSANNGVHLNFAHCLLTTIASAAFINIQSLVFLDLSWNELTGETLHPDIFRGPYNTREYEPLINLTTLDLSHNKIHVLSPRALEHLPNLKTFSLNHNPLKVLGLNTVSAISLTPHLQFLDLSSSSLEHVSEDAFSSLKHLETLILQNNSLRRVPESISSAGESLRYLDFSQNSVKELNDESFLGLTNLTYLNISNMKLLESIRAGTFEHLSQLNSLYCSNNPNLTYIDKDAFRELKRHWPVAELHLNNNSLQQISQKLAQWDQLDYLELSDNPWRCDCQLHHAMKKIQAHSRSAPIENELHHPVCFEPAWLSGVSLYRTPARLCEKPQLNGTLNGILQVIFKGNEEQSRKPKWISISVICLGLTIVLVLAAAYMLSIFKTRQRFTTNNEHIFMPIRYTIAQPME